MLFNAVLKKIDHLAPKTALNLPPMCVGQLGVVSFPKPNLSALLPPHSDQTNNKRAPEVNNPENTGYCTTYIHTHTLLHFFHELCFSYTTLLAMKASCALCLASRASSTAVASSLCAAESGIAVSIPPPSPRVCCKIAAARFLRSALSFFLYLCPTSAVGFVATTASSTAISSASSAMADVFAPLSFSVVVWITHDAFIAVWLTAAAEAFLR